jgi:hypothetical protein
MSWIPCSRSVSIGLLAVVLLASVGTAAAVTVEFSDPAPAEVGQEVEYCVAVEQPFRNAPDQWTVRGSTGLENATWTLQVSAQGDPVDTQDAAGENVTYDLSQSTSPTPTLVNVTVSGDVPAVDSYSYDDPGVESVELVTIARVTGGNANELESIETHRYTEASREARTAIDSAIESVGSRNDKIEQAISAYDTGNFENARSLAEEAESGAQSGQLLLYAAIAIVVLAIVGGGIYYWRTQRDTGYKLQ